MKQKEKSIKLKARTTAELWSFSFKPLASNAPDPGNAGVGMVYGV